MMAVLFYCSAFMAQPIRIIGGAFLAPPSACRAGSMNVGCVKATCCTDKCYLDDNGVHHCVHDSGESCDCGLSSSSKTPDSVLIIEAATLVAPDDITPELVSVMLDCEFPRVRPEPATSIPTPPPRSR
jgi:hypothetical protein